MLTFRYQAKPDVTPVTRSLHDQPNATAGRWLRNTAELSGELSVGDVVIVDDQAYSVEPGGFAPRLPEDLKIITTFDPAKTYGENEVTDGRRGGAAGGAFYPEVRLPGHLRPSRPGLYLEAHGHRARSLSLEGGLARQGTIRAAWLVPSARPAWSARVTATRRAWREGLAPGAGFSMNRP
jgi:hypothetical protein